MLAKWNPFSGGMSRSVSPMPGFDELFSEANSLLRNSLFSDVAQPGNWSTAAAYVPAADILETENEIRLMMDLPGHDAASLQIKLEGDTLTVQSERKQETQSNGYLRAERAHGVFARSFVFPNTVDPNKCEARYENGVLTVTLPKREEAKPRTINIKVRS